MISVILPRHYGQRLATLVSGYPTMGPCAGGAHHFLSRDAFRYDNLGLVLIWWLPASPWRTSRVKCHEQTDPCRFAPRENASGAREDTGAGRVRGGINRLRGSGA